MIQIEVHGNRAQCKCVEQFTSGMVGLQCMFTFDSVWNGLSRTAVFIAGNEKRDVLLTGDTCIVPWEVLKYPDYQLMIGVYGTNTEGTVVIPTIYVDCGKVASGAELSGDKEEQPTPTMMEQVVAAVGVAVTTANAVKAAAEAGEFKGETGPQGPAGPKGDKGDSCTMPDMSEYQRIIIPDGADVGQIARIAAVDMNGKPTAWESVNMPQGGSVKWRKLREIHCDGMTQLYSFNTDENGNAFNIDELCLQFSATTATSGSGGNLQVGAGNKLVTGMLNIGTDCRHVLNISMSFMKFAQAYMDCIGRGAISQSAANSVTPASNTMQFLQNATYTTDGTPYTAVTFASRQDPFVSDMVVTVWGR